MDLNEKTFEILDHTADLRDNAGVWKAGIIFDL